jgi:hypothetical protein
MNIRLRHVGVLTYGTYDSDDSLDSAQDKNMKNLILGLLLISTFSAQASEMAGRVLVAVGDATAIRGNQQIRLTAGTKIEAGDTLHVGDVSNLQVRFTDEAIMALRPNTILKVEQYAFANNIDTDKSIFGLVKGGLRTITGVIARASRNSYAVKSQTATVGIRGTHFTLVQCDTDCRDADGKVANAGTYGGVTDGRISVTNDSGESEFGKNEYFYVATKEAPPTPLIAPPPFLRDQLAGRQHAKTRRVEASDAGSLELSGRLGAGVIASQGEDLTSQLATTFAEILAPPYRPSDNPAVVLSVTGFEWNLSGAFASVGISGGSPYAGSQGKEIYAKVIYPYWASMYEADMTSVRLLGGYQSPQNYYANAQGTYTFTDPYNGFTYTHTKARSVDVGYSANAGELYWGRYAQSFVQPNGYTVSSDEHWSVGSPVVSMPSSGLFAFSHIGGTSPTDQFGNRGAITSGGQWVVDFSSMKISTASPVTWVMPSGSAYSVSATNASLPTGTPWSYKDTYIDYRITYFPAIPGGAGGVSITCTAGCSGVSGFINPQLSGSQATGLAVGIATSATVGGATEATGSIQAYKR